MMRKFLLILAAISAAAVSQTTEGSAADTSKHAGVDTTAKRTSGVDTSTKKIAEVDTSIKQTAVVDTSARQAAGVDTSAKKIAEVDTSIKQAAVVDTSIKRTGVVDTSARQIAVVDTSVRQTPAVDTLTKQTSGVDAVANQASAAVDSGGSEKGFRLPGYTFHAVIMAASAAIIAATFCFFLTRRRRNESRRFLTTTRLSVLDKSVQRGCRYMEANYQDPALTPEAVCRSLVTGKAYLDALFMNELGINVQDFIVQVRVNAIKNSIASAASPDINDICAKCGFADREEAERCFSIICGGVSIIDYARSHRGEGGAR